MHRHVRPTLTGTLLLILLASPFGLAAQHPHSYDVLHYDVTLTVDIDGELVSGNTLIQSVCVEPGLDCITLDLAVLTVDSVVSQGTPLAYSHDDQVLVVNLARPYAPGDTFGVQVFYGGHPGNTGPDEMGGFYFEGVPKLAFQVGINRVLDPFGMAKYWMPCWDWPCDKATAEYHVTVPGTGKKVICNGILAGVDPDSLAGTVTYHWIEDCPIAPGLMTINAGRFAQVVDSTYDWISYWVYPRLVDDAIINFENVPAMMDVLTEAFGPYPFPKCAYVAVPTADVSHQNCITYPTLAVTPTHNNDWHVSGGLARQWWGASVTPADWRDLWLTESFGRYGQPLFEEATLGTEAYHDYIYNDLMLHTFADADPGSPIYDPTHPGGHTIYEKGTVVLHMLRFVLGDSVFFGALRTFSQTHAYSCAITADFQNTAEAVSGQDLDWFFSEWIYDCGWPEFDYAWDAVPSDSGWTVNLMMDQIQQIGPVFTMPMEIRLGTAAGDTIFQIWIHEVHEEYAFITADTPSSLVLDPNHWVLMKSREMPYAGVSRGERLIGESYLSVSPNPTRQGMLVHYRISTSQYVTIGIYDVTGRLVAPVLEGPTPTGTGTAVWDGMSLSGRPASPGVYFCRMVTGRGTRSVRLVLAR
jgi:aminopeptidase N